MSRQEALAQYQRALKQGRKQYNQAVAGGHYPYLQVLDELLDDAMVAARVNLGLLEIPTEQIVGTKTKGRRDAFSSQFMPLLSESSEFAMKWIDLCRAHLSDEGLRDPIRCFEYLGRFYVLEGNKRVSVLKSYGAATIPAYVTRLVPVWSEARQVRLYYDFLGAYQRTGLYQISFTRFGSFPKLQAALGHAADYTWSEDDRRRFLSGYAYFRKAFSALGGDDMDITPADAMLVWLKVYPYEQLKINTLSELTRSLSTVWQDVQMLRQSKPIAVSTNPMTAAEKGLFRSLKEAVFRSHLDVALVNVYAPRGEGWTEGHVRGIRSMEQNLGERVSVRIYNNAGSGATAVETMERAVSEGAQVIFASSPTLIDACRKIAAKHPHVRVMNCSVSMPYSGVRTYYGRMYEGKFIAGAIAAAMSPTDELGYVANYPIFGTPAAINAFALGARMVNPRACVRVEWSCVAGDPVAALMENGVEYISTLDIPTAESVQGKRGVCRVQTDGTVELLAQPYWGWDTFYTKLVESILDGSFELSAAAKQNPRAMNYWWGMSGGVIGMRFADSLPAGVRSLAMILKRGIVDGSILPFSGEICSQDGAVRCEADGQLSSEEILHMDWLCDNVIGEIPEFERILPEARDIVRMQGIYRDSILPVVEGVLL